MKELQISEVLPWDSWRAAAMDPTIGGGLAGLYVRLDADVAKRGPTCWVSGKCCRFDSYGHRLYVTGLEVAWVLGRVSSRKSQVECRRTFVENHVPHEGGTSESLSRKSDSQRTNVPDLRLTTLDLRPAARGHGTVVQDGCVFQAGGLCTVHAIRPMGCRVFFCQQGTEDWQRDLYEKYLNDLRALHDAHGVPYRYLEWRSALQWAAESMIFS